MSHSPQFWTEAVFLKEAFGRHAAWVDLVNSEQWDGFGNFSEHLDEPSWIATFLSHWQLGNPDDVSDNDLRQLRAVLRPFAEALAREHMPVADQLAKLNAYLAVPIQRQLRFDAQSPSIEYLPMQRGTEWILAQIAGSVADFLISHQVRRIKVCANDGCRWLFYDETKGNTKRWCTDNDCGNRDKVRRFRARQAANAQHDAKA